jgi:steroid 5-alpha reductase family enzyme
MRITGKTITLFFTIIAGCFIIGLAAVPVATNGPLATIVAITALTTSVSFLCGLFTDDYSWTDRLWSTSPVVYGWIYAYASNFTFEVTLAAVLVTLWGIRLTFNFARRGGYTGGEDYRWPILRKKIGHPLYWHIFNLLFIAVYQQFLFICFTLPLNFIGGNIGPWTILGIVLAMGFLFVETLADQQQYTFQQAKYGLLEKCGELDEDYDRGFRTTGLFAHSRHPNYLGELGFWWSIYLFTTSTMGTVFHWSMVGPLLLTLLFVGSTIFTEGITASKYPSYEDYKKSVWPIFPKLWR